MTPFYSVLGFALGLVFTAIVAAMYVGFDWLMDVTGAWEHLDAGLEDWMSER